MIKCGDELNALSCDMRNIKGYDRTPSVSHLTLPSRTSCRDHSLGQGPPARLPPPPSGPPSRGVGGGGGRRQTRGSLPPTGRTTHTTPPPKTTVAPSLVRTRFGGGWFRSLPDHPIGVGPCQVQQKKHAHVTSRGDELAQKKTTFRGGNDFVRLRQKRGGQ